MGPADTTAEVRRRQIEAYRAMTPDDRMALGVELSEAMREVTLDGIRSRRPGLDEQHAVAELIRLWHGPGLARRVG